MRKAIGYPKPRRVPPCSLLHTSGYVNPLTHPWHEHREHKTEYRRRRHQPIYILQHTKRAASERVVLDDQVGFHLDRVGYIGQLGAADEGRR